MPKVAWPMEGLLLAEATRPAAGTWMQQRFQAAM